MISRKHFQMIADELKNTRTKKEDCPEPRMYVMATLQWRADVEAVGKALARLNPRFDYGRFSRACGFEEESEAA